MPAGQAPFTTDTQDLSSDLAGARRTVFRTAGGPTDLEDDVTGNRLLVVDDDEFIADVLASGLRFAGYQVAVARTGREALTAVDADSPDLVVLDVMMPELDGFDVVRHLRRDGVDVPVLFLTARDTSEDKIAGLRAGGDDYVTKPFNLDEVAARIEAILRRASGATQTARIEVGDLTIDDDAHQVTYCGARVELSATEYRVLHFLARNRGRVMSRAQILDHVWQYDFGGASTVVETYISYLRKKLDMVGPPLIHTIRGVGYVLRTGES